MNNKIAVAASSIALLSIIGGLLLASADVSHLPLNDNGIAVPLDGPPVTEVCLGCICEAISNCNRTLTCQGDVCGLFRITWAYWADAGKPTIQGQDPKSNDAFSNCVIDPYCAARAVQGYMTKFGADCNDDGVINCYDHAAIHKLGGYGCKGDLTINYYTKLDQCLKQVGSLG